MKLELIIQIIVAFISFITLLLILLKMWSTFKTSLETHKLDVMVLLKEYEIKIITLTEAISINRASAAEEAIRVKDNVFIQQKEFKQLLEIMRKDNKAEHSKLFSEIGTLVREVTSVTASFKTHIASEKRA